MPTARPSRRVITSTRSATGCSTATSTADRSAAAPPLAEGDWLIPSVGADYGKAAEQLALLREHPYPTAMALPLRFPATPAGVAGGLRRLADRFGRPLIAYVKDEGYVRNDDLSS